MSTKILFVFEGERTEMQIVKNLTQFFLNDNTIICCAYCNNIYRVYKEIEADGDLDTFSLLKNIDYNLHILRNYTRDDFAEIYMFFDYDGHDSSANDSTLRGMLDFFNEETDKGKLYISYPMVESLKHIKDYEAFRDLTVECKRNIRYKSIIETESISHLKHFKKYDLDIWKKIIETHLKKLNYIINGIYSLPNEITVQTNVFLHQLEKYIQPYSMVSVLNAFPIFLHDYYGNNKIKDLIK